MHVLVVDDEPRMVELVRRYLDDLGIRSSGCYDGESALAACRAGDVDAVVLDLMLPRMSGTTVCRTLRAEGDDVPVLMLTARGAVHERVAGLEAGADDYLVKPFALEELHARLRAILRRKEPGTSARRLGDVVLDPELHRCWVADIEVKLSRREFAVLRTLLDPPGRVVSRQRLLDEVWDNEVELQSNAIEVHVSKLRAHLEASSSVRIGTVRGVGYRLERVP